MVTVYRFYVSFKLETKTFKLYRKNFRSAAFVSAEIATAALKSWSECMREYYAGSGKHFEVVNYYIESTLEDIRIEDLLCLGDCRKHSIYKYAYKYWLPF